MKNFNFLFLYFLVLTCTSSFAQQFNCDNLLQGGLYSFTSMTNTGSFSKDLRTYYLSEQFKTDMKSGKWGGSITIPIQGVPVSLGMNYSEDEYNQFKSKLLNVSELNIKSDYYKTTFSSIPNTNLYQAYVDCVNGPPSKTGFVQGTNVETENTVVFAIHYRKQAPDDPMPIVQNFNVEPAGSVISGDIEVGHRLNSFSILVTCKRDPEKDLVLSLKTDRGSLVSKSVAEGSFTSNSGVPIGTIITSFLSFKEFNAATKNNEKSPGGIWTSIKSKWAPCDGRSLPNSKYSQFASQTNAPDLRGLFLRGGNSFDPDYTINSSDPSQSQAKPNPIGIYQHDAIIDHTHNFSYGSRQHNADGGIERSYVGDDFNRALSTSGVNESKGGPETIPKNISIYYYIKIN